MTGKQVWWICGSAIGLCFVLIVGLGVYMMGDSIQSIGSFASHPGHAPGPTVQVNLPAGSGNADDFDAMPAVAVMNGPDSASLPTSFSGGSVTAIKKTPPAPIVAGDTTMVTLGTSPLPTPASAGGLIFSSAGFSGFEMCAVDLKTGNTVWQVQLSDNGPSTATVSGDNVLVNTESCTLFNLDAATGKERWSKYLGSLTLCTPTVHDGRVYAAYPVGGGASASVAGEAEDGSGTFNTKIDSTHAIVCLDLRNGRVLWQSRIDSDLITSPVIHGDTLYAGTFAGTLYAYDRKTGTPLAARHNQVTSLPSPHGEHVYFTRRATQNGKPHEQIVRADPDSLKVIDVLHTREAQHLDAALQGGSLYAQSSAVLDAAADEAEDADDTLAAEIAARQAEENIGLANVSSMQAYQGSRITVGGDTLYCTMSDTVLAIDPSDGSTKWQKKLDGNVAYEGGSLGSPPIFVDGNLIYGTVTGQVFLADGQTGEVIEWWAVGEAIRAQPIVVDGRIVAPSVDGRLHIIDTKMPNLTGWTEWGGDARHGGNLDQP